MEWAQYEILDLSGNIWEWCATKWQGSHEDYRDDNDPEGSDPRVVRGGSFASNERGVRCASRGRLSASGRDYLNGFRVVLAPGF